MRKQTRSAALLITALVGASAISTSLASPVLAEENQDRTDSEQYTDSRADYWAAREAWAAKKAAQQADVDYVEQEEAVDDWSAGSSDVGGGGGGGGGFASPAPVAEGYPTNAQLYALRLCESTDNYTINTGNGYYGAYQFSAVTWWWLGYTGYPHHASPAVQDEAVRYLYSLMGWSPWPACSRYLGFA